MKRESFVFYTSFHDAISKLPKEYRLELYEAIAEYALTGEEPKFEHSMNEAMFALIRPNIDANNKRYMDGKKGGRRKKDNAIAKDPPEETNGSEREKPVVAKNETSGFEEVKPNEDVNVNVNENENETVNGDDDDDERESVCPDPDSVVVAPPKTDQEIKKTEIAESVQEDCFPEVAERIDSLKNSDNMLAVMMCKSIVHLYFDRYKEYIGHPHPANVTDHTLKRLLWIVTDAAPKWCYNIDGFSFNDWMLIIEKHFRTRYAAGCDYNLNHFASDKIMNNRAYETIYREDPAMSQMGFCAAS